MRDESEKQTSRKWKTAVCQNKVIAILVVCIVLAIVVGLILIIALPGLLVEKERHFRLPVNVLPIHYALEIKPYLIPGNFWFEGKVEIKIKCEKETHEIVLHSSGLETNDGKIAVHDVKGNHFDMLRVKFDKGNQFLILQLQEELQQNETYLISISYKGTMNDDGSGFYVSSYEDSRGVIHYIASTMFASFKARTAFPCFDEPAMKAKFDITIVRWTNMTSLSNMNKVKTEPRGEYWMADLFQTTPKMSTYLVAFFVGDYVETAKGMVTIWSSPDEANHTDFALETSLTLLKFYNNLLTPYPLPKLDMVAVNRLSSKAMENWGLIIYDERFLLYDENDTDNTSVMRRVSSTIAHEIAHQWFGNLVTPKWWSHIWLSEGIATYMEHIALRALFPHWYQIDKTTTTLYDHHIATECSEYNIAITAHKAVNKESLDRHFYDKFVYLKGAAIIRMVHGILDQMFWKGLANYLDKYAYGVAEEKDLWECLTKAQYAGNTPEVNMTERMTSWTHLPGLPIVNVERDYDRKTVTFSQNSCIQDGTEEHKKDLWHVPITLTTSEDRQWNPGVLRWLTDRNVTITHTVNEKQWILVNGKNTGYYIVNYDRTNWNLLADELRRHHEIFPLEHRFKIIADAVLLEKMGHIPMDTVMDLSLFIAKETKLSVLTQHVLDFIFRTWVLLQQSIYVREWKEYMVHLLEHSYKMLQREGIDVDAEAPPGTSDYVSSILCMSNYNPCIIKAKKEFQDWKERLENHTKELQGQRQYYNRFCPAIQYGNYSDWEFIFNAYNESRDVWLLVPLACSTNRTLIKKLLQVIFEENQSMAFTAVYVLSFSTHWAEILTYVNQHFDEIASNDFLFGASLEILRTMKNPVKYEQCLAVFKKFLPRLGGSKREDLKKTLDKMEQELPKLEKQREVVENWLERKPWLK